VPFHGFTATNIKNTALRRVAWCNLTDVSEVRIASIILRLILEAVITFETPVNFYQTSRSIPQDNLHTRCCENLKLHLFERCHIF
jgi:hypothetical protein